MRLIKRLNFLLILLVSACATFLPMQHIEIPLSHFQRDIEKRFPVNHRYLDLYDVAMTQPKMSLRSESDRLVVTIDTKISSVFTAKPLEGKLLVSGQLRMDSKRRELVLVNARLESLGDMAEPGNGKLVRLGQAVAEDLLNDKVLYTFAPDAITVAGQRFNPTRIATRENSLVVSFEPAR